MRHFKRRGGGRVSIDTLENRRFFSTGEPGILAPAYPEIVGEPIVIGTSKLIDITFTADNGRKATINAHGAQAAITFSGSAVPLLAFGHGFFPSGTVETVTSILVTDASPGKASLSEKCAYGIGSFNVGSITGGDLGSINFADANLTGSLTLRSLGRLTLASIGGATLNIARSVSTVKVTGAMSGSMTAGSIGSLSAAELVHANVTTNASYNRNTLQIGSVIAKTGIEESNIISAGNIGSITTGYIQNDVISAGATLTAAAPGVYPTELIPESSGAFVVPASIRAIRVLPGAPGGFFSNSVIAARTIQSASIGQLISGGGIAAHSLASLSAIGPSGQLDSIVLHLGPKDLHTSTTLRNALARLQIPFSEGAGLADNTMFYNFDVNILR